jgi:nucleotide-binding universal stress UspA family protein
MFYEKILVPLDGSERAEAVIPHVKNLAHHDKAKVVLTRVVEPVGRSFVLDPDAPPKYKWDAKRDEVARTYLSTWVERLQSEGIDTEMVLMWGLPVDGILQAAKESDADLIALTSQGRTGLKQVVYGSVAAGVMNRTNRPFLMVHTEVKAGKETNQQILVPLDGSRHAEAILPHVESVAQLYEAQVTLMRVMTTAYQTAVVYSVDDDTAADADEAETTSGHLLKRLTHEQEVERFEKARHYLQEWRDKLQTKGLNVNAVLLQGRPVEGIVHVAESIDADLIAMTSHGRSGLAQVFYGSVSVGVLNRTKRPLLLVRPKL